MYKEAVIRLYGLINYLRQDIYASHMPWRHFSQVSDIKGD